MMRRPLSYMGLKPAYPRAPLCHGRPAPKRRQRSFKDVCRLLTGRCCVVCGSAYLLMLDHIIPLVHGGADDESNLQPMCQPCNSKKGCRYSTAQMLKWYAAHKQEIDQARRCEEFNRFGNEYGGWKRVPSDWVPAAYWTPNL